MPKRLRIEGVIPGVGSVELKARWRVKLVGEGFVIAESEGRESGTPQAGHNAIIESRKAPAPPTPTAPTPTAPPPRPPSPKEATAELAPTPALRLTAEQYAGVRKLAEGGEVQAMNMLGIYHSGQGGAAHPRRGDCLVRKSRRRRRR